MRRGVEREPVRLDAYRDLEGILLVPRCEHRDGILTPVAGEDEAVRFGDERTCHSDEARYRRNVPISRAVDHVDRIVARMCNVEPVRGVMNISVIETAIGSMFRLFVVVDCKRCLCL